MDLIGREQAAECRQHPHADLDLVGPAVGEFEWSTTATVEVDDGEHHWRTGRVDELVDREAHDRADRVGHRHGFHVVDGTAFLRDPGRRQVDHPGVAITTADEAELPVVAPMGRRCGRAVREGRLGGSTETIPRQDRNFP